MSDARERFEAALFSHRLHGVLLLFAAAALVTTVLHFAPWLSDPARFGVSFVVLSVVYFWWFPRWSARRARRAVAVDGVPVVDLPAWLVLHPAMERDRRVLRRVLAPLSSAQRDCFLVLAGETSATVGELLDRVRLLVPDGS